MDSLWPNPIALITEKQKEYIKILSSYESTKEQDQADIKDYLGKVKKADISQLSKVEASELIRILLRRPAEYEFPCGKKGFFSKREVNSYNVLGELEGCLHACPDSIDVNNCSYWQEHESEEDE